MQRQFSPYSYVPMPDGAGYLYDEPKPPIWRRMAPFLVVLLAGAAACFAGLSTGKKMAGELTQLNIVQADPQLVQRETIGQENPDLMMPQPTLAPPTMIAVVQPKVVRRTPRPSAPTRSVSKPSFDPFADSSIPFQPAEDYTPGIEHEKTESLQLENETPGHQNLPNVEASSNTEAKTDSPKESAPKDNSSPVPVAE